VTAGERFLIELRVLPDPDGVPGVVRVRHALKRFRRTYRLQCDVIKLVQVAEIHGAGRAVSCVVPAGPATKQAEPVPSSNPPRSK
jgi:hypothetical protein